MVGQLWLSIFRLSRGVDEFRPAGTYGAAFVSYEPGSPLTYSGLLVARLVPTEQHGKCVSITDIWVDSPASVAGGRELWAIPKGLCDFDLETGHRGPLSSTEWTASAGRRSIASASFTDVQQGDGPDPVQGDHLAAGHRRHRRRGAHRRPPGLVQGAAVPRSGDFAAEGPLGWMGGARHLASFRQADFRMSFG